jgi:nucleotide-binding universal stress UspA family protein
MYTDIIIGFDGSAPGRDALALGRRLALSTSATTTVVCVHPYEAPPADVYADSAVELSWRRGAERILDTARRALDDVPDVTFRVKAETSPARALREVALEAAAAVIVVGSTRRERRGRFRPGTTADQTLNAAPCAIAVAPAGYAERCRRPIAGIVGVAVDGGEETDRLAGIAAGIARAAKSKLRLLIAIEARDMTAAEWALDRAATAAGPGVDIERRIVEGPAAAILAMESDDLDVLVVGSRGRGPVRRVVLGTVGGAVIRDAACPVLAIPRGVPEQLDASIASVLRGAAR